MADRTAQIMIHTPNMVAQCDCLFDVRGLGMSLCYATKSNVRNWDRNLNAGTTIFGCTRPIELDPLPALGIKIGPVLSYRPQGMFAGGTR
ncbi:hypothetical protein [Sphingobium yanoikuyae]|uniref:hypothetical protein n=1 Tax=Sphingobium yanoikuyae TaxID=13690 RepID=UPI0012D329A3|nr:hypothetical protein [Sphingobium yanoikuyae]